MQDTNRNGPTFELLQTNAAGKTRLRTTNLGQAAQKMHHFQHTYESIKLTHFNSPLYFQSTTFNPQKWVGKCVQSSFLTVKIKCAGNTFPNKINNKYQDILIYCITVVINFFLAASFLQGRQEKKPTKIYCTS